MSMALSGAAQGEAYIGGNLALLDYSVSGFDDASLKAIVARLGTEFSDYVAGEVRLGYGIGDDSISAFGFDVNVELDYMYGAYLRAGFPAAESFYPYAVLGYTQIELTASAGGFSASDSDSDVSFGLGADIGFSDNTLLNLEYMNYFDKDGAEISAFSIGITGKF